MDKKARERLDRMFEPKAVAVFGAVHEPGKFGHMIIQSLLKYGYRGQIYPVHPKGGEVFGLPVYTGLDKITGPVDLACVSVPAERVPPVLEDCLAHHVAGVEILSSGFSETGEKRGMELQEEVARISRKGLRDLGPNCFGAQCTRGRITVLPGFDFSREPGPVSLISQSGGVAADFGHEARMTGLGLSKVLSFGNGCDLDANELLDYLSGDPDTEYIGAYLEGVKDGRRFMGILRGLTRRKPVLIWKGGLTPLGKRMTKSHTGSMAGESGVWKGLLAQAGAVGVGGLEEMVDTLMALCHLRRPGNRVAILGGGGAIGVFSSDVAHQWGLELPLFGSDTQKRLKQWFPTPGNSMANPIDTGSPVIPEEAMRAVMEEVLTREPVDVLITVLLLHPLGVVLPTFMEMDKIAWPTLQEYCGALLKGIVAIRKQTGKDVVVVMENRANLPEDAALEWESRTLCDAYLDQGVPVYPSVERALRAIGKAASAGRRVQPPGT